VSAVWEVISDYSHYYEFMPRTPVTFLVDPNIDPGLFLPQTLIRKGIKKLPEIMRALRHHVLENEYREGQR